MGTRTYLIGQGYSNLRKHSSKTFSTMFIICATMIVLGLFIISLVNIEANLRTVASEQGMQAFISDDVEETEIEGISAKISSIGNIKEIKYLNKEEALEDAKDTLKDYEYLLDGLETSNPFPRSFIIIFDTLKDTEDVKKSVETVEGIYKVSYNEEIINAVLTISEIGKFVIFGIGAVMVVISVFIISNTIKLAVYSNKREIYIMKYIGATSKFIKSPFVTEGILMGLGSAAFSWVLTSLAYVVLYTRLPKVGSTLGVFGFVPYSSFWYIVLIAFLILGIILGGIGSNIAAKRYLKEFRPAKLKKQKDNKEDKRQDKKEEKLIQKQEVKQQKIEAKNEKEAGRVEVKEDVVKQQPIITEIPKHENIEKDIVIDTPLKVPDTVEQKLERRRRRNKFRIVIMIALISGIALMKPLSYASTTSDDLDDVRSQQSAAAKKFNQIVSDIKIYDKDIAALDKDIEKYSADVNTLTAKVGTISKEVDKLEKELQGVSVTYQATQDVLNTRLRALYENGFVNVWEVLFTSEGVTDFLSKYNVIITLVSNDQKTLNAMQGQKEYINNLKKDAELRKLQIEQVEYDVKKSKQYLENAKASKQAKVDKLEASKQELKALQSKLRKEAAALERKLAAEIAAAARNNLKFNGEFTWPVPGVYKISALFRDKEYYYWAGSVHKGTDIDGSTGDRVVAAQTGTVITASGNGSYNYGYGNYVTIDHGKSTVDGNRYITLYAHLKSVSVSKGQTVVKGQQIGLMGSTGWSTGSHLHFELRKNGTQINAMKYYPELSGVARYYSYGKWITFSLSTMGKYQI